MRLADRWRDGARKLRQELRGLPGVLFTAWVLLQLSMPFTHAAIGDAALRSSVVLSVLLQCGTSLAILGRHWPRRTLLLSAAVVVVMAWGLEAVGSATGLPFGRYHYTDRLQPQLGHVPLLIPLAWLMMLPPAWAVATRIAGRSRGCLFVTTAAFAFTAWDLFLDPQMVEWGLWEWDQAGSYFGIPVLNYAGWLLGSALITAVVRPQPTASTGLVLVYTATWLLESVGLLLLWGLPGPALWGFLGMGLFVLLVWSREEKGM